MAFSIDKEHKTLTLSYWRVRQVNFNEDGSGRVAIAGYRNEAERDADPNNHYETRGYPISEEMYEQYFAPDVVSAEGVNRVQKAYEFLRNEHTEEWQLATDA